MKRANATISVIVVNYNSAEHLNGCLESLCVGDAADQILIVDNASSDNSVHVAQQFAASHSHVEVMTSDVNLGYAGAVTMALPRAAGTYVMALNPDMRVADGCLKRMIAFLDTMPRVAAANPLILLSPDGTRINAAGQAVHVTGLGFNRLLGQPQHRAGTEPVRVSGVQGGAVIVRKALLEEMGGWDSNGFLYHEDVELSWLLHLMGYDLYCVPEAVAIHAYRLTMYPEKFFLLERNRIAMLISHMRPGTFVALSPLLLATELMIWGFSVLRGWRFVEAKVRSYQSVWQERTQLKERKRAVDKLRRSSDWQVLRKLQWSYTWNQFITLGRERGRCAERRAVADATAVTVLGAPTHPRSNPETRDEG